MGSYGDIAFYAAGGVVLVVVVVRLAWRGLRRGTDVSPVSEQWLAERRSRRTPD